MSDAGAGPPNDTGIGIGQRLADAREALGLAAEDVADALNLPLRVVLDLEAEQWERLPAPAFNRGYIRAYAKLLDLDSNDLVADYEAYAGSAATVELEVLVPPQGGAPSGLGEVVQRQPGSVISGAVVAVVVLLGVLIWYAWPGGEPAVPVGVESTLAQVEVEGPQLSGDNRPEDSDATAREIPSAALPSAAAPPSAQPPPAGREAALDADADSAEGEPPPRADTAGDVGPDRLAAPAVPANELVDAAEAQDAEAAAPVAIADNDRVAAGSVADVSAPAPTGRVLTRRLTESGDDVVTLVFAEDCWVEVKDATNANIYGDLSRAGDTLELVGEAPFRVLLGYAPGVEMAFNDDPVPLANYTRNNVAALWLGRRR